MDFMTALRTLLELIETAAMLGALVYITRGIRLKDNTPARRLYESNGFEQIGVRPKYYDGIDAILMKKDL
jgi:ribosomal protein S18 acetylase RimI-like enzyme